VRQSPARVLAKYCDWHGVTHHLAHVLTLIADTLAILKNARSREHGAGGHVSKIIEQGSFYE
jgi:hypothetical protein